MYVLRYKDDIDTYNIDFERLDNIVKIKGRLPIREVGFYLSREGFDDKWNYLDFKTLYKSDSSTLYYSNDGSVWVEPVRDVEVSVVWNDADNALDKRPDKITATINGETVELDAPDWEKIYKDVPESVDIIVEDAETVEGYNLTISGTSIEYAMPKPYEPTIDEQLAELADAVADIDERLYALEEG